MFQYINGFSCAIANDKSNFILHVSQRLPSVSAGQFAENEVTPVASIVMDVDTAIELGKTICELTAPPVPDEQPHTN